jgi:hypothetical protein
MLSSCESEYVTVAATVCQAIWLTHLLINMIRGECSASKLKVDNQSCIAHYKNPIFHDRSKHIEVHHHLIRDCIEEGIIIVSYMAMAEQLVDLLTKEVGWTRFQELRDKIGVKATGDHVRDYGGELLVIPSHDQ